MITTVRLADTETTGTSPEEGAVVLEYAHIDLVRNENGTWGIGDTFEALFEYEGVIPPEARAVHHISPAMVAPGAPGVFKREDVMEHLAAQEHEGLVYAAHNAKFDSAFLPELKSDWLCSYRCALHIYPDAPSYKNQVLRYYLGIEPDADLIKGLEPHRALYDIAVTAGFLLKMLEMYTPEQLLRMTSTPVILKNYPIGKHRGEPFNEVPRSYLSWALSEGVRSDDMDFVHTLRTILGN